MITPEDIRQAEARTNFLHERIDEAFAVRDRSDDHWRHWENACSEFHAYKPTLFQLGEPAVLNDITAGSGPWRSAALLFLELDPWFFRSGYLKGKVARALKRARLQPEEVDRINGILVAAVDSRNRQEFREFCRLAVRTATARLVDDLGQRQTVADGAVRARAAQMLSYIERHSHAV